MRSSILSLSLVLALPLWVRAATIHVPADQPTIQAGINVAIPGDSVLVAPGTYTGADNKELDLKGKAIVLRSEGGAGVTIIDCEQQGRGFYFQAGEGPATIVEGFTVTNGRVSGLFPDGWGGGILCIGSSPMIRDCTIEANEAAGGNPGGGMGCYDSSPHVVMCVFRQNTTSGAGGGAYLKEGAPNLDGCTFQLNSGGGIMVENSSPTLTACIFENHMGGGGARFHASSGVLSGCTFAGNVAPDGGAVYVGAGSTPMFSTCEFLQNSAVGGNGIGGAISVNSSMPTFTDCRLQGNTATEGGAMRFICCPGMTPSVSGCSFADNSAGIFGGAVACVDASPVLDSCVFVGNLAGNEGGAIHCNGGATLLRNCTLYGNRASSGSGMAVRNESVEVEKSIIAFAPTGQAIACLGGSVALTCTDIYANLGGNWTGCIASQLGQDGNFSSNPLFCDATSRDFTIRATSPCAPGNSPPGCGLIGALPAACGITDVADSPPVIDQRLTVIPNPVRGTARFELGSLTQGAALNVFDSQGRLVEEIQEQDGNWTWTPDPSFPAGVYFARSEAGPVEATVKFLYLR